MDDNGDFSRQFRFSQPRDSFIMEAATNLAKIAELDISGSGPFNVPDDQNSSRRTDSRASSRRNLISESFSTERSNSVSSERNEDSNEHKDRLWEFSQPVTSNRQPSVVNSSAMEASPFSKRIPLKEDSGSEDWENASLESETDYNETKPIISKPEEDGKSTQTVKEQQSLTALKNEDQTNKISNSVIEVTENNAEYFDDIHGDPAKDFAQEGSKEENLGCLGESARDSVDATVLDEAIESPVDVVNDAQTVSAYQEDARDTLDEVVRLEDQKEKTQDVTINEADCDTAENVIALSVTEPNGGSLTRLKSLLSVESDGINDDAFSSEPSESEAHGGTDDRPEACDAGAEDRPEACGAGAEEQTEANNAVAEDRPEASDAGVEERPEANDAGAEDRPEAIDAGAEDRPEAIDAGAEDRPEAIDAGAEDRPEACDAGAEDRPEASDAGAEDRPEASDAGAEDRPEASDAGAEDRPEASDAGAEDRPEANDAGAEDRPEANDAGAEDRPEASDAGAEDRPDANDAGAEDRPEANDAGAEDRPEANDASKGTMDRPEALKAASNAPSPVRRQRRLQRPKGRSASAGSPESRDRLLKEARQAYEQSAVELRQTWQAYVTKLRELRHEDLDAAADGNATRQRARAVEQHWLSAGESASAAEVRAWLLDKERVARRQQHRDSEMNRREQQQQLDAETLRSERKLAAQVAYQGWLRRKRHSAAPQKPTSETTSESDPNIEMFDLLSDRATQSRSSPAAGRHQPVHNSVFPRPMSSIAMRRRVAPIGVAAQSQESPRIVLAGRRLDISNSGVSTKPQHRWRPTPPLPERVQPTTQAIQKRPSRRAPRVYSATSAGEASSEAGQSPSALSISVLPVNN